MPRKKEFDDDLHIKVDGAQKVDASNYCKDIGTTLSDKVRKYIKRLAKKVEK